MLGDRNFGTFANLVLLKRQGADGVFRRHQARGTGVKTLKRLGKADHLVRWHSPRPLSPPMARYLGGLTPDDRRS